MISSFPCRILYIRFLCSASHDMYIYRILNTHATDLNTIIIAQANTNSYNFSNLCVALCAEVIPVINQILSICVP